MKRVSLFFLTILLVLTISVASASEIKVNGLNEAKLYDLYSQVQSQILLNTFSDADSYKQVTNYDDIERNPSNHTNEKLYFEGTVLQVLEGSYSTTYRIASSKKSSNVFLVTYTIPEGSERFLEDDTVSVYATFINLNTYESTTNKSVTVPYCDASLIIRTITDKTVKSAAPAELDQALSNIRARLDNVANKDKGYTKLTKTNYEDYARHVSLHDQEKVTVSGKVLQALEGSKVNSIRLAVDSDSNKVIYVTADPSLVSMRVLEDDSITVRGTYTGLYTYSSVRGGDITIPSLSADSLQIKGFTAAKNIPKDKNGSSKISKKVFENYARLPSEHIGEKITFSAKVLQVIEGNSVSQYRMAVDNDSDYVFLVNLANDNRTVRILENDKVTVVGTFDGLMSYESTLGATITVPQCTADSVVVPGKSSNTTQKNTSGTVKVTKKNYESFARDESTYMDKPLSFTAKVIQVVDGDSSTTYRLAVDKSSKAMFIGVIKAEDLSIRILEDDIVEIEGTSTGLYSYNSTMGGKITIPSCQITGYKIKGYTAKNLGQPNANGYYKITKANYEEIARNPDPYREKNITFKAKVIQVVERSGGENIYRVTVDSNRDCVFYVEYTLPAGAPRILEKDVVTLKGTYYGIYSYSTTLGSQVSVPALIATEITK